MSNSLGLNGSLSSSGLFDSPVDKAEEDWWAAQLAEHEEAEYDLGEVDDGEDELAWLDANVITSPQPQRRSPVASPLPSSSLEHSGDNGGAELDSSYEKDLHRVAKDLATPKSPPKDLATPKSPIRARREKFLWNIARESLTNGGIAKEKKSQIA